MSATPGNVQAIVGTDGKTLVEANGLVTGEFKSLGDKDPVVSKKFDHYPQLFMDPNNPEIIVLNSNSMKKCRATGKPKITNTNDGFGINENYKEYRERVKQQVEFYAELSIRLGKNAPSVFTFQEAPTSDIPVDVNLGEDGTSFKNGKYYDNKTGYQVDPKTSQLMVPKDKNDLTKGYTLTTLPGQNVRPIDHSKFVSDRDFFQAEMLKAFGSSFGQITYGGPGTELCIFTTNKLKVLDTPNIQSLIVFDQGDNQHKSQGLICQTQAGRNYNIGNLHGYFKNDLRRGVARLLARGFIVCADFNKSPKKISEALLTNKTISGKVLLNPDVNTRTAGKSFTFDIQTQKPSVRSLDGIFVSSVLPAQPNESKQQTDAREAIIAEVEKGLPDLMKTHIPTEKLSDGDWQGLLGVEDEKTGLELLERKERGIDKVGKTFTPELGPSTGSGSTYVNLIFDTRLQAKAAAKLFGITGEPDNTEDGRFSLFTAKHNLKADLNKLPTLVFESIDDKSPRVQEYTGPAPTQPKQSASASSLSSSSSASASSSSSPSFSSASSASSSLSSSPSSQSTSTLSEADRQIQRIMADMRAKKQNTLQFSSSQPGTRTTTAASADTKESNAADETITFPNVTTFNPNPSVPSVKITMLHFKTQEDAEACLKVLKETNRSNGAPLIQSKELGRDKKSFGVNDKELKDINEKFGIPDATGKKSILEGNQNVLGLNPDFVKAFNKIKNPQPGSKPGK